MGAGGSGSRLSPMAGIDVQVSDPEPIGAGPHTQAVHQSQVGEERQAGMAATIPERMAAMIEGDFVIFLIGMRINKPWKVNKWWPVFMAMPKMLKELEAAPPEVGFLGHN